MGLDFTLGPAEPLLQPGCQRTAAWPRCPSGTPRVRVCRVLGPGGWAGGLLFLLGPSPGRPLPVCGPSMLHHSLCDSMPLLQRVRAAAGLLPLASFLVAGCALAGAAVGPGLS